MPHTTRWFGTHNPVSLFGIRQAGCAGVENALHQPPVGAVWPVSEIQARQQFITADNATVVPLHWAA